MRITREVIEHVAKLSRLSFKEKELEGFISQLNEILQYVEKLNELDTSDVPPTSHMFFTKTPMREDRVREEPSPIDRILENAPQREDNFFIVPRVIE
ncbi:MAG: Asp-tRNA(Asn)/Glu-tRNA(Gln) amidotransferase subunit GatC [Candidatus Abyssobacteria bacterium SURF_17]|uniref:Aspartyl/glutamyl-tRNA(Asn/Gln) amidotransferase subunit C n=1 Tax=Candidatus Abyssobacteria bacterium SURF_17 TaxID=2093361 RepID=A0A419EWI3_9BACT|nr:MAG: Asp-tRNA(Asn)/Glu-tRNA(Gln) amidotransferase subunit GatC [Candidatus Abyssubacteria bacterium SURF_17]